MKESDYYLKIVEWSEEDQCYIGYCPGLFLGGCHGGVMETMNQMFTKNYAELLKRI